MAIKRGGSPGGMENATYEGTVKSWNGSRGFGFITSTTYDGDIMFDRNVIPEDAREVRGKFLEGQAVVFELQIEADGRAKATSVRLQAGDLLAGAIKTYSAKNGYGFISSSSLAEEVRFNTSDLPPTMAIGPHNAACLKGELVIFKTQAAPLDGKLRIAGGLRFQSNKIAEKLKMQLTGTPVQGFAAPSMQGFGGATMQGFVVPPMQAGFGKGGAAGGASFGGGGMMAGVVKSFSEQKGYGFINLPGMGCDAKFDRQTPGVGTAAIQAGTTVQLSLSQRPGGQMLATQVVVGGGGGGGGCFAGGKGGNKRPSMSPAPKAHHAVPTKRAKVEQQSAAQEGSWADGVVKSFNEVKGFGFITSTSSATDIYFMRTDIQGGKAPGVNITGTRVSFQTTIKADGKVAAQIVTLVESI